MNTKQRIKGFNERHKKGLSLLALGLSLLFCAIVGWFIGRPMIEFVSSPQSFRAWVDKSGIWGRAAFIGMMVFQVIIALIPGEPLEIGAGYAFGVAEGTILCVIGTTLGSIIVILLVRSFGVKFVEVFFQKERLSELKILKSSKKRNLLIFLVFFFPGTPKDLLTYFVGLTDIKFGQFIVLVSVSRLPSVITSTLGGSALGGSEYKTAIIVFAITLLVSGLGWIAYKLILNLKNHKRD